jgi:hypothetical protein
MTTYTQFEWTFLVDDRRAVPDSDSGEMCVVCNERPATESRPRGWNPRTNMPAHAGVCGQCAREEEEEDNSVVQTGDEGRATEVARQAAWQRKSE